MKSSPESVADFESNSKSVKSYKQFRSKIYQSDNQQKSVDSLKPRSNKNERLCKKYCCDYFYIILHFVVYKNGSIVKN